MPICLTEYRYFLGKWLLIEDQSAHARCPWHMDKSRKCCPPFPRRYWSGWQQVDPGSASGLGLNCGIPITDRASLHSTCLSAVGKGVVHEAVLVSHSLGSTKAGVTTDLLENLGGPHERRCGRTLCSIRYFVRRVRPSKLVGHVMIRSRGAALHISPMS